MSEEIVRTDEAEIRRWRKSQRELLVKARLALTDQTRVAYRKRIDRHLSRGFPNLARGVVGITWPLKGEYDARHLALQLRRNGATTALPMVVAPRAPLEFRRWHPGVVMAKGVYDIPYPAAGPALVPTVLLVPMVGFDRAGYRLGYGGGFYDRTLAALTPRPAAIGIAYDIAAIATIRPQPYDIPMDYVVTERGIYRRDPDGLAFLGVPKPAGSALTSPVCYANEFDSDDRE